MNAERLLQHYEQIADAPDAIARLRRFILDLAVRGKLVPQHPMDEPASELLKRIIAEKERLAKAGEIRKPKALEPVDQPPFELPHSWNWVRIRQVTSDRGQEVPTDAFTYIDVGAINKEEGVVGEPSIFNASEAPSRARKVVRRGDVIYSCVRPYLLNIAVIDTDFVPKPIASTAFAVLNGHGYVVPRYIWTVLRSPFMVECVEETQRGLAYPAINDADFAVLPFPLPPLAEQHRIVAKVDELMALCDELEAARTERETKRDRLAAASLARLNTPDPETFRDDARFALDALPALTARPDQIKQLRQTILNIAVRGKLVPQDPADEPASELLKRIVELPWAKRRKSSELELDDSALTSAFDLPRNWAWASVNAIVRPNELVTYGILKPEWVADGVPTVRVTEMRTGVIDLANLPRCHTLRAAKFEKTTLSAGDLLVSKDGTIGKTAFVPPELAGGNITQHVLRFPICDLVNRHYVRLTIDSPFCQAWMVGETKGVALQGVNVGDFRRMPVPLPPLAEQHRIVTKVDELMALCDQLETSLTSADEARKKLLGALLAEALAPVDAEALQEAAE
ncbi:restriction endonuclease subunit S [Agrobacterium tumefaciens]|uniref:restriction endonuclease subunit S n=1 Tax=Agrobacterium tumefaciens TaxID=358 RepID=UPI003B9E7BEF